MSTFNAGAIEANLTLGRSDWLKDLKKTKAEIEDLEKTTITIGVDLDTDNAHVAMDNLELFLEDLDNSTYTPNADLDTDPAHQKLDALLLRLEEFDASRFTATLDADADNLMVSLSNAELFLEDFDGKHVDASVGLDAAEFKAERDIILAQIDELDAKSIDVDVDVDDTAEAIAELEALQAQIDIVDGQTVHVDVDYDEDALQRLVGSGAAGGGGGGGGYMSFWMLLIKAIIILSPVFSAAIGVMSGAIVGYSAALVGAIGPAAVLAGGIAALIAEFNSTAVADRTPEMQAFADALDDLKDAYDAVIPLIQGPGFELMAHGLELAAMVLPTLVPLFNATAEAIDGVLASVEEWIGSPEYQEMLGFFGEFGIDMLVQWLAIFGNVIQFFGRLFAAAAPFARVMMDGLEEVTQGWADWAATLDENQAFIDFMQQAVDMGPRLLDMLGSLLMALINVGEALEPFAGPMIDGLTAFFDVIAEMDPDTLTLLIGLGAALYTIAHVAPLIVTAAEGVGALAGALGIALGPLVLIAAAVGVLAYAVYDLWQNNEDFREGILDTWEQIQDVVGPIVEDIADLIREHWGGISKWAEDIWTNVEAAVEDVFTSIEQIIKASLAAIEFIWTNFGEDFLTLAERWFGGLAQIVGGGFDVIAGIWQVISSLLTGDWEGMWEGIEQITEGAWHILQGMFKMGWAPIQFAWSVANKAINAAWDATMGFLKDSWNKFRSWMGDKWQAFKGWVDKWTVSPGELWTAIKTKWNDVREWVGDRWSAFKTWVSGWAVGVPSLWDAIQTQWSDMREWVSDRWTDFKSWVSGWSVNPSGMFDGFKNEFRSVINTIIGWWNALSFTLDIPNKIPGLPNSVSISTPNVPMLARGAYVTEPTLAMVGEGSEPELVTPESKMKEIVAKYGGSQIDYSKLAAALADALRGILGTLRGITAEDLERLIREAGVQISLPAGTDEGDYRELMFELRRAGFGGL